MNSCMGRARPVLWPTRGGPRPRRAGPSNTTLPLLTWHWRPTLRPGFPYTAARAALEATRPSPRAPHSSTRPTLPAALCPFRRPDSGLALAPEPLAREPTSSFRGSPCTKKTNARGLRLQRLVLPAARGGEEGGENAGPALRRALRTTAEATERAGWGGTWAQATPTPGHAHWPGCRGQGGRGLRKGRAFGSAGLPCLRSWASGSECKFPSAWLLGFASPGAPRNS